MTSALLAPAAPILRALHQSSDIVPDAANYLRISIVGVLPFLAFVVLRQSLQAMHRVAPIVWTIVIANATNALLNWVFVYGHLGSPALGVAGSAIATAISRWLMTILLLVLRVARSQAAPRSDAARQLAVGADSANARSSACRSARSRRSRPARSRRSAC